MVKQFSYQIIAQPSAVFARKYEDNTPISYQVGIRGTHPCMGTGGSKSKLDPRHLLEDNDDITDQVEGSIETLSIPQVRELATSKFISDSYANGSSIASLAEFNGEPFLQLMLMQNHSKSPLSK